MDYKTKSILLLCSKLGCPKTEPLNLSEYNQLAVWLQKNKLTPADLFNKNIQKLLPNEQFDVIKILNLLGRGMRMALKVEEWQSQGIWLISRADSQYPKFIKTSLKWQSPAFIFGIGCQKNLSRQLATVENLKEKLNIIIDQNLIRKHREQIKKGELVLVSSSEPML